MKASFRLKYKEQVIELGRNCFTVILLIHFDIPDLHATWQVERFVIIQLRSEIFPKTMLEYQLVILMQDLEIGQLALQFSFILYVCPKFIHEE